MGFKYVDLDSLKKNETYVPGLGVKKYGTSEPVGVTVFTEEELEKHIKSMTEETLVEEEEETESEVKVTEEPVQEIVKKAKVIKVDKLRIRTAPFGQEIAMVNNGEEVTLVTEPDNGWAKVKTDKLEGYCMTQFLDIFVEGEFKEVVDG